MTAASTFAFILLLASVSMYAAAIRWFFVASGAMDRRMRLIGASGTVVALIHLTSLAIASPRHWRSLVPSIVIYVAGATLFIWAAFATRRQRLPLAYAPQCSVRVVEGGPYALIRHPFYTAYSLTWLAGAVATWHPAVMVSSVWMYVLYWRAARYEERQLLGGPLAAAYDTYRRRVGMFMPYLQRRQPHECIGSGGCGLAGPGGRRGARGIRNHKCQSDGGVK